MRTNEKLSQEKLDKKLAEKLGVSHRHLGDLERGSSNGSVKILIDIAEYVLQYRSGFLQNHWNFLFQDRRGGDGKRQVFQQVFLR